MHYTALPDVEEINVEKCVPDGLIYLACVIRVTLHL